MNGWLDLAVVGGGASGLLCAAMAAGELPGKQVAVIEAGKRVGTKLLATGNGRCNLSNTGIAPERYHGGVEFAAPLLRRWTPQRVTAVFEGLGLLCREEEERIYPYSMQASSVLNLLRERLSRLGVQELCEFEVRSVKREQEGFCLFGPDGKAVFARRLVLATGGRSQTAFSSGYELAKQLGHTVTPLFPCLCPIFVEEQKRALSLKGVRAGGTVTLLRKDKPLCCTIGEIQFTAQGLSGICVFQLARLARPGDVLSLDLAPEHAEKELAAILDRCGSLQGVLPKALAAVCTPHTCKQLRFTVRQTAPFQNAQVTAGGVPLEETASSCASKRAPGAYLLGELLDLDGDCGGFNLHWAWATALTAAESITGKEFL